MNKATEDKIIEDKIMNEVYDLMFDKSLEFLFDKLDEMYESGEIKADKAIFYQKNIGEFVKFLGLKDGIWDVFIEEDESLQ